MKADTINDYASLIPIVQAHLDERRYEQALADLSTYVRTHPPCAEAENDLAVVHHLCGHAGEALQAARAAVRLQPDNPEYACNLASLLAGAERFEDAVGVLVSVLEANPRNISAMLMLGEANWQLGRVEDAEVCFRAALDVAPGNETASQAHARCTRILQKNEPPRVTSLIFSKDRAMQLDAALRSLRAQCRDFERTTAVVLFKTTSERDDGQYQRIARQHPDIHFARENDFFGQLWGFIEESDYLFFQVDDCLFVSEFEFAPLLEALDADRSLLGASLRLGRNTTQCYMRRAPQRAPEFQQVGPNLLRFRWVGADCDFGYPLEVSSSLYRTVDLRQALGRRRCTNPNTLEAILSNAAVQLAGRRPNLLCLEQSVAFCNPVNVVQTVFLANRSGSRTDYRAEALRARFDAGQRIRVEAYFGHSPKGCHEEVSLEFEPAPEDVPLPSPATPPVLSS